MFVIAVWNCSTSPARIGPVAGPLTLFHCRTTRMPASGASAVTVFTGSSSPAAVYRFSPEGSAPFGLGASPSGARSSAAASAGCDADSVRCEIPPEAAVPADAESGAPADVVGPSAAGAAPTSGTGSVVTTWVGTSCAGSGSARSSSAGSGCSGPETSSALGRPAELSTTGGCVDSAVAREGTGEATRSDAASGTTAAAAAIQRRTCPLLTRPECARTGLPHCFAPRTPEHPPCAGGIRFERFRAAHAPHKGHHASTAGHELRVPLHSLY